WPLPAEVDPLVIDMPASAQDSIDRVGQYLLAKFPEPKARVKAIHDYVALRLTYDFDAFKQIMAADWEHVPSQEAVDVFAARKGVCEGYARLMTTLGKAAGIEIAYITGYIRDAKRRVEAGADDATVKAALEGYGHAWNAVKLDGQWLLLDATWDD